MYVFSENDQVRFERGIVSANIEGIAFARAL